jgi:addiction module RelE/StbE family toxin
VKDIRWTQQAADDLEVITDYLFDDAPERAEGLVRRIYNAPFDLLKFPYRGRPGRKPGTRELVLSPLPWVVIYRVADDAIHVLRILHGAQRWP